MTHYSDSVVWFLLPFAAIGQWWVTWRVLDELFGWRALRRKARKLTKENWVPTENVVVGGVSFFSTPRDPGGIELLKSDPEEYFRQYREGLR